MSNIHIGDVGQLSHMSHKTENDDHSFCYSPTGIIWRLQKQVGQTVRAYSPSIPSPSLKKAMSATGGGWWGVMWSGEV